MLTFTAPQLLSSTAYTLSYVFSFLYVGSIYVSARARLSFNPNPAHSRANGRDSQPSEVSSSAADTSTGPRPKMRNERWRDDSDVIKARLVAVSAATVVCCTIVFYILSAVSSPVYSTTSELLYDLFFRLGCVSPKIRSIPAGQDSGLSWKSLRLHLITPVLFLGPLYATFLSQALPGQKHWSWKFHVKGQITSWQGIRNIIIGPVTEELVFRGCTLAVLNLAGISRTRLIFLSPLSFGIAHIHHFWDVFNRYGRTPRAALHALTVTLFQLTYTTIFGCYTSYLFLRTSSIYPPISAHMFCNTMRFPAIGDEMKMFPRQNKRILIAYLLGITSFACFLHSWTYNPDSFYWANYVHGRTGNTY